MPHETQPLFPPDPVGVDVMYECGSCGIDIEQGDQITIDGISHCQDCVHSCEVCNMLTVDEDEIVACDTGVMACSTCRFECYDCYEYFPSSLPCHLNARGRRICEACAGHYYCCDNCNETIHENDVHSSDDGTYCQSCYEAREEESQHTHTALNDYHYKPRPIFFKQNGENTRRFYGVEIETESNGNDEGCQGAVDALSTEFYGKVDGSLNDGAEVVSHPGTFAYWNNHNWKWAQQFKRLGYTSYDTSTCGMHIHISRNSLSELDRFKLLAFFKNNARFITKVSRRKREADLRQWASIDLESHNTLALKAKGKKMWYEPEYVLDERGEYTHDANGDRVCINRQRESMLDHGDRYTAINMVPEHTVEIRIFKGTLSVKAIKRNIAFVHALCIWVSKASIQELTAAKFAVWLQYHGRYIIGKGTGDDLATWILQIMKGIR